MEDSNPNIGLHGVDLVGGNDDEANGGKESTGIH
jgi:hypothetical protein